LFVNVNSRDAPDNPAFFGIWPDTGIDVPEIRPDTGIDFPDIRPDTG
jgi:hypothetical protein